MTAPTPATPEVLRARPCPWLSRLWVRVSLVLLLICAICIAVWWWPRRTMVAVWWVGGEVYSEVAQTRTNSMLGFLDPTGTNGLSKHQLTLCRLFECASEDCEIENVFLDRSSVGNEWLRKLRGFPRLKVLIIHGRHLGPGLDHLRDSSELNLLTIESAADGNFTELRRLPQLKRISLKNPRTDPGEWNSLTELPNLYSLAVFESPSTTNVLAALPELPQLGHWALINCTGFDDDDLRNLDRLPNLKSIGIRGQTPMGDAAFEHLSQLEHLESVSLMFPLTSVTRAGLQQLTRLKNLKEISVWGSQCSPAELQMLRDELPNCSVAVY